jgi:hypothetical protein
MQNTSVTGVTVVNVTLRPDVTAAARLCSRNAICCPDHAQRTFSNKFKSLDHLQKRGPYAIRADAVNPWLYGRIDLFSLCTDIR